MRYDNFTEALFGERLNRFVARVALGGRDVLVHVPNTGRCREILLPGARCYLTRSQNPGRKYPYTLNSVYKKVGAKDKEGELLINIDSAGANRLVEEALIAGAIPELADLRGLRREVSYGASRLDFAFTLGGRESYLEVKGVTLEEEGLALFPDAPTPRGTRHLRELALAAQEGHGAYVLFIIQMAGTRSFEPFVQRDPDFAAQLLASAGQGVQVLAYAAQVEPWGMTIGPKVPVRLPQD